jgi:hypothetical protein
LIFAHFAVLLSTQKRKGASAGSAVFLVQAALVVPLGAGTLAVSLKFEHAFAAFQFYIGRISISFQEFLFGQDLGETAPALGAGGLDSVAFFGHGTLLSLIGCHCCNHSKQKSNIDATAT